MWLEYVIVILIKTKGEWSFYPNNTHMEIYDLCDNTLIFSKIKPLVNYTNKMNNSCAFVLFILGTYRPKCFSKSNSSVNNLVTNLKIAAV